MTKHELDFYKAGYMEARAICIGELRRIADLKEGHLDEIIEFIGELEKDEQADHWEAIQEEFPGITEEEYESTLKDTAKQIREKYFHKNGYPKLRLIRPTKE